MSNLRNGCACAQCAAGGSGSHDAQAAGTWEAANVSPTSIVAFAYTGDYRIDCMLEGLENRWNASKALGSAVTVTYSFMTSVPRYGGNEDSDSGGFAVFTAAQKTAARAIFTKLQAQLGISFQEVSDTGTSYGQIRFGNNYQDYSAGYAWLPGSGGDISGDVWMDLGTPANLNPTQGTWGYATLLHEIGHALGLKHPGNYNIGTVAEATPGNWLGTTEDNTNYTIMSYYDAPGGQPREWFGMYDMLALKKLYGADAINAGNTTHKFNDDTGAKLVMVDDTSGTDTIDLSGVSVGAKVDMRPGGFSSVGKNWGDAATGNLSIELNTVIENLVGTSYGDTITGNDVNNRLTLGSGTNTASGGAGIDTAVYAGTRGGFTVNKSASVIRVDGGSIHDTLSNIERLEFSNTKLAFDFDGAAGQTAKLLGAVLGAGAVANAGLAGSGVYLFDSGWSYEAVAKYALDSALGANASYGTVVDTLFRNVTGALPSASQKSYYVDLLQTGHHTKGTIAVLAAELDQVEMNIGFTGLQASGLAYA